MIKEERLKELIEGKATIYYYSKDYGIIEEFNLKGCELYHDFDDTQLAYEYDLENLYETQAEAEFVAEFGNIEKVVKMPRFFIWEELQNYYKESDYYSIRFVNNSFNVDVQYLFRVNLKTKTICIKREVDGQLNKVLFEKPLTKENYIDACRLCVKLFKGEEVWKWIKIRKI